MIEYADILNPLMVVEYKKDIYEYLMTLEKSDPVQQNFLQGKVISKYSSRTAKIKLFNNLA